MDTKEIDDIITFRRDPEIHEQFSTIGPRLRELFQKDSLDRTVLGIDIYHYSKYPTEAQDLIPYCFQKIYDETLSHISQVETVFFDREFVSSMPSNMIGTGDGCFQILETPLQAVIFAIYFQANLSRLNTGDWIHMVSHLVPNISLRYSITLDRVFSYNGNWFGPAIINNARLLAADRLNRTLLSQNAYDWFSRYTNGVETLQRMTLRELGRIQITRLRNGGRSLLIPLEDERANLIKTVNVLKISDVTVKGDVNSVYSLHLQVHMTQDDPAYIGKYVVTIGNLNTQGLS